MYINFETMLTAQHWTSLGGTQPICRHYDSGKFVTTHFYDY